MNWTAGFTRLWVVLSVAWVLCTVAILVAAHLNNETVRVWDGVAFVLVPPLIGFAALRAVLWITKGLKS